MQTVARLSERVGITLSGCVPHPTGSMGCGGPRVPGTVGVHDFIANRYRRVGGTVAFRLDLVLYLATPW